MSRPKSGPKKILWIPCKEQLPHVFYDTLGNWMSERCLLFLPNAEYDMYAIGIFNPCGVFETGNGGFVGSVRASEDSEYYVAAWMPLPPPYKEEKE